MVKMQITQISSKDNERIKLIKKLQKSSRARKQNRLFIAEGIKAVVEYDVADVEQLVYCDENMVDQYVKQKQLTSTVRDKLSWISVPQDLFGQISNQVKPQGIMALVTAKYRTFDDVLINPKGLYLMLADLQDPGNLGTIIRLADAINADGIIGSRETVDIYNPKVVNSSMGSLGRVHYYTADCLQRAIQQLQQQGVTVWAATLEGSEPYYNYDYRRGTCFMIGNEGAGIEPALVQAADDRVKIPMVGQAESLNAGLATAVLAYEAVRQRQLAKSDTGKNRKNQ